MPVEIVVQVDGKVWNARVSGEFIHPPRRVQVLVTDDRRRLRFDADGRSLRQLSRRLQHDYAVLHYAFVAHNTSDLTTRATRLANAVWPAAAGLAETNKGSPIEGAVAAVIQEGKIRTYDLGGQDSTLDMAKAIAAKL